MPHKEGLRINRLCLTACCFLLATAMGVGSVQAQARIGPGGARGGTWGTRGTGGIGTWGTRGTGGIGTWGTGGTGSGGTWGTGGTGSGGTSPRRYDDTPSLKSSHIKEEIGKGSLATLDTRLDSSGLVGENEVIVKHVAELARRMEVHMALMAADRGDFKSALRYHFGEADKELKALLQVGHHLSTMDPAYRPASELLAKVALLGSSHKELAQGIYRRAIAGATDRRSLDDLEVLLSLPWASNKENRTLLRLALREVTRPGYLGAMDAPPTMAAASPAGAPRANIVSVGFLAGAPASVPRPDSLLLETNQAISKIESHWEPSDYNDFIGTVRKLRKRSSVSVCTGGKCKRPPRRIAGPKAMCIWKCRPQCCGTAGAGDDCRATTDCVAGTIHCMCGG